jgi:spermidine/putrescine transport system permease protein
VSVVRNLLANPWRKHRFLAAFTWLYIVWAIVPVVIAIGFSFNAGRSRSVWQGFSLEWWIHNPDLSVLHDPTLTAAIRQSLILAVATMAIATPIGVGRARRGARWGSRAGGDAAPAPRTS